MSIGRPRLGLLILLLTVAALIAIQGFGVYTGGELGKQLELRLLEDRLQSIRARLLSYAEETERYANDYACWDETFEYFESPSPDYEERAITAFTLQNVDAVFLIAKDGTVRLERWSERVPPDPDLRDRLRARALQKARTNAKDHVTWFDIAPGQDALVLASAWAVRRSDGSGTPPGWLAVVRLRFRPELERDLGSEDTFRRLEEISLRSFEPRIIDLLVRHGTWVDPKLREPDFRTGYIALGTVDSPQPIVAVSFGRSVFRTWYASRQNAYFVFSVLVALGGILAAHLVERLYQAEAFYRASEERYRTLTQVIPDAVIVVREGRVVSWNPAAERMFGYAPGEVIGRPVRSLFVELPSAPTPVTLPSAWNRARETSSPLVETLGRHRSGQEFPVELSMASWTSSEGTFCSLVVRDITERRRQEAALRESETRYRVVANFTANGELWLSPEWTVLYCSPSFGELTGYSPEEIAAQPDLLIEMVHPDDRPHVRAHMDHIRAHPHTAEVRTEFRILHRSGSVRWVVHVCRPVMDEQGKYLGRRASYVDITPLRQAQEERDRLAQQLSVAQRMESLGNITGSIAHDFNNLLAGILGNIELALDTSVPPAVAQALAAARRHVERAAELVRQLLAFAGRAPIALRPMELNQMIRDSQDFFQSVLGHRLRLELDLTEPLPAILGDPTHLQQVVVNLLLNAAEAARPESTKVTIRTRELLTSKPYIEDAHLPGHSPTRRWVQLSVEDEGCGIPPEIMDRIFEPFFTTRFFGRGLGLAVVRGIAHAHRAALAIQSTPDRGTVVTLAIPVATRADTKALPAPVFDYARWKSVLVIDDEAGVRDVVAKMLRRLDVAVVTAGSAPEGLDILRRDPNQFDAVFLDWTMPGSDGASALRALRTIRSDLAVVVMSGYDEGEIRSLLAREERVAFLPKPFQMAQLEDLVRQSAG